MKNKKKTTIIIVATGIILVITGFIVYYMVLCQDLVQVKMRFSPF